MKVKQSTKYMCLKPKCALDCCVYLTPFIIDFPEMNNEGFQKTSTV